MEYTVENVPIKVEGGVARLEEYINTSEKFDEDTRIILYALMGGAILEASAQALAKMAFKLTDADENEMLKINLDFYQKQLENDIKIYQAKQRFNIINGGKSESN